MYFKSVIALNLDSDVNNKVFMKTSAFIFIEDLITTPLGHTWRRHIENV